MKPEQTNHIESLTLYESVAQYFDYYRYTPERYVEDTYNMYRESLETCLKPSGLTLHLSLTPHEIVEVLVALFGFLSFGDHLKEQRLTTLKEDLSQTFKKKNADYGDAFRSMSVIGCWIRLTDKLRRLETLTQSSLKRKVKDESIEDTVLDALNYCILACICIYDYDSHAFNDIFDLRLTS
jgi:hypothetical protein